VTENATPAPSEPILEVSRLEAMYGGSILALRGLSLRISRGEVVALLGANGAGKTTALKAISSLLATEGGRVTKGTIHHDGRDVTRADPADLVERGLALVFEGRRCFAHLSVLENLIMGDVAPRRSRSALASAVERVYGLFPKLRDLRARPAGFLSGGEQQMLAIGRALMTDPRLVLLDEPSMGLAPQVVDEIFETVRTLNRQEGVSFLLSEQNASVALEFADRGYVLENGRVTIEAPAAELLLREDVRAAYLGSSAQGAPSGRSRPRRSKFAVEG
jgi:branched-chain amino acid transport system ATP-binding protein